METILCVRQASPPTSRHPLVVSVPGSELELYYIVLHCVWFDRLGMQRHTIGRAGTGDSGVGWGRDGIGLACLR